MHMLLCAGTPLFFLSVGVGPRPVPLVIPAQSQLPKMQTGRPVDLFRDKITENPSVENFIVFIVFAHLKKDKNLFYHKIDV